MSNDFADISDLIGKIMDGDDAPAAIEKKEPETVAKVEPTPTEPVVPTAVAPSVEGIDLEFDLDSIMDDVPTVPDVEVPVHEDANRSMTEDELEEEDCAPDPPIIEEDEVDLSELLSQPDEPAEPAEMIFQPAKGPKASIPMPTFTADDLADTLDIRNFATLVTLNTRRWHAKVKDRKASLDAATQAGAVSEAFETQKRLLVGADEKLKRIHKAIDDARTKHYQMTLPWSTQGRDDTGKRMGGRLLPNTLFMEYTKEMAHAKAEMDAATQEFIPAYPALINIAQGKLGTRFDPSEYPNPVSIAGHFDLSFEFHPVPVGGDFQGLADMQVSKLANTLESRNKVMLENAMQEVWARLYDLIENAAERWSDPKALFHYTLVDKLREAGTSVQYLNVTGDPVIEEIRAVVEKELTMNDAKEIRKDDHLRARLGRIAKACLKRMNEHGS